MKNIGLNLLCLAVATVIGAAWYGTMIEQHRSPIQAWLVGGAVLVIAFVALRKSL